jgi:hypothetical protein
MRAETEAMMLVRGQLCERLEMLRTLSGRRTGRDFAVAVAGVRQLAAAYGLNPVVQLAEALERAGRHDVHAGGHRALYLDRLEDAIGCTRVDPAAGEAMIASVSIRLGA